MEFYFQNFFGPFVKPFTTETSQRRYDRSLRRIHVDGQSCIDARPRSCLLDNPKNKDSRQ